MVHQCYTENTVEHLTWRGRMSAQIRLTRVVNQWWTHREAAHVVAEPLLVGQQAALTLLQCRQRLRVGLHNTQRLREHSGTARVRHGVIHGLQGTGDPPSHTWARVGDATPQGHQIQIQIYFAKDPQNETSHLHLRRVKNKGNEWRCKLSVHFHVMTTKPLEKCMKCRFDFSDHCLDVELFARYKKVVGQPIAGRMVVSRWLFKFNFSILSMSYFFYWL